MSQIPSDPGTDSSRRRSLTYDELIALFVAFLTLGSILFWGFTRSGINLFGNAGLFSVDGAAPLVDDLDSVRPLDLSDDLDISTDTDGADNSIGFGTAEAVGAGGVIGDLGRSGKEATEQIAPPSSRLDTTGQPDGSDVPATSTTVPVTPIPPKQAAQPAETPPVAAAPQSPLEASREAVQFQDVPDDYWAKPYIDALSERLVIDGISDDTFAPEEPVTRAQLASAIAQAFPLDNQAAAISFSDIETDYWATEAIDKAVQGGFMNGFPDKSFQPTQPVPRAQVLTALVTGLNASAPADEQAIISRYSDADQIPNWAIGKMAAATQSNIVVNYPNLDSLKPNQAATRAEVAAMIYQTLAAQGRIDDIDGDYVVKP